MKHLCGGIKMSLKEKLMDDLKIAMKEKDVIRKNTVQMVRSAILQFEKDNRTELDDEGVIETIARELKKRRDVLPEYEKSGRDDMITPDKIFLIIQVDSQSLNQNEIIIKVLKFQQI